MPGPESSSAYAQAKEDSGPGIAQKELDQIFYRVKAVEGIGSGIGLALVKELVDVYRGQISVSSEPGRGGRFKISLAINRAAFRPEEIVADGPAGKSGVALAHDRADADDEGTTLVTLATPNQPLALVVEDNADLRQFIADCLGQQYRVLTADSGTKGWQSAVAQIPDIIISDVMMPGMDGFQLTETIKKDERTSHIPVILLTAKAGQQHKLDGLKIGADDYLTKPFDALELLTRMANLIAQRRLLRQTRLFRAKELLHKRSGVPSKVAHQVGFSSHTYFSKASRDEFGISPSEV